MVLLIFVSAKLIGGAFGYHLRNEHSLIIVGLILAIGIVWSLVRPKASGIK
jgi:hypothetical protein